MQRKTHNKEPRGLNISILSYYDISIIFVISDAWAIYCSFKTLHNSSLTCKVYGAGI